MGTAVDNVFLADRYYATTPENNGSSREDRLGQAQRLLGEAACRQIGLYPIPATFKLSVVIPVYNEEQWIGKLLDRVQAVPIAKEIIIVDDCSTDGTRAILQRIRADNIRIFYQPVNGGKGAALREGLKHATGD